MKQLRRARQALAPFVLALTANTVYAVDGVVLIDQNKALAGNVTPGDAPGFPVRITQAGSYRLSGNLVVPDENTAGIEVSASAVTLDLNGFGVFGPGRPGTGRGVFVFGGLVNVAISNGTVAGMGADGVGAFAKGARVTNVRAHNNGGIGINTSSSGSAVVLNNIVMDNRYGIAVDGTHSVVRGNVATGIGQGGRIGVVCPSSVVGNAAAEIFEFGSGCTRDQNLPAP